VSNGCEAAPDHLAPGTTLESTLSANLVPADDVDRIPVPVTDHFQVLGNGQIQITLTAPAGVSMKLRVLRGTTVLGSGVSGDRSPATVTIHDPSYFNDDSGTLIAEISWVGTDRSAEPYTLERSGDF